MLQSASFLLSSDMARFWPTSLCVPRRADITMRSSPGRRHGGGGPPSWRRWDGKCHDGGPPSRHSRPPSRLSGPPSRHSGPPSRYNGPPSRHSGPPSRHQSAHELTLPKSMYLKQANGLWHSGTTRQQHDPKGCGMPKQDPRQGQERGKPGTWPS